MNTSLAFRQLEIIAAKGTCLKRRVGCFVAVENSVVIEAANGMPVGSNPNCLEGGCPRCATQIDIAHGTHYDLCFCLHAEERAIVNAARYGIPLNEGILYTSYQPCIMCLRKIVESGIAGVRYCESWGIPNDILPDLHVSYGNLVALFREGFYKM